MFHTPAHKDVQHPAGQVDGGGRIEHEDHIFSQTLKIACLDKAERNRGAVDAFEEFYRRQHP